MPPPMYNLVDGYNLLYQTFDRRRLAGPGNLERARTALIDRLVRHLSPEQQMRTTIVFDSNWEIETEVGPVAPDSGIKVVFASDFPTADAMIEALLNRSAVPRQTLVVSSDHQVQDAARRRGAAFMDSLDWLDLIELERSPKQASENEGERSHVEEERNRELDAEERRYWLAEFGYFSEDEDI